MEIVFQNPVYLWFLTSIGLLVMVHFFTLRHTKRKALKFANFEAIARVTGKQILSQNLLLLSIRIITLLFVTLALAGTTIFYIGQSNDFDFVLAIDTSSSMSTDDFEPNRLEAAKKEAISFINRITSKTNIGVVSFSGASFIESGLTDDLDKIKVIINSLKVSEIGGTDLGEAIITSSTLLANSKKAKVAVLLTDGQSNVGTEIAQAINYANKNKVLIYTIGIGTEEGGSIEGIKAISRLDEESLISIAFNTDGKYFRAIDKESLANAYSEISSATKERLSLDLSLILMTLALLLLFVEWGLVNTKYRTIP